MPADARRYLLLLAAVAASTLLAAAVERLLVSRLRGAPGRGRPLAIALARALSGTLTAWGFLAAARVALPRVALPAAWDRAGDVTLAVAAVVVATVFAARLAGRLVALYTQREDTPLPATSIFVNVARGVVLTLGALMTLDAVGVRIGPLLTALGVGGLAIALALQSTLSNLFAGLQLIASRQIGPGDHVRLAGGDEGVISDVGWRVTTIRSASADMVIVPNATLANSVVTNYSARSHEHDTTISVPVPRSSDIEAAASAALEIAEKVQASSGCAAPGPRPTVRFGAVGDSQVTLEIVIRARSYADAAQLRSEIVRRLVPRLAAPSG